jgi:hypothetical protein
LFKHNTSKLMQMKRNDFGSKVVEEQVAQNHGRVDGL